MNYFEEKEEARNLEGKISEMIFNFCRDNGKQPSVINISDDVYKILYRGELFSCENYISLKTQNEQTIFGLDISIVHNKVRFIELE